MADVKSGNPRQSGAVGHVSVHLDSLHPRDVQFSFERQAPRMSGSLFSSLLIHAALLAAIFVVFRVTEAVVVPANTEVKNMVFLEQPGPGGGGGGGGSRSKEPPPKEVVLPKQIKPQITPVVLPENSVPMPDFLVPATTLDEKLDPNLARGSGGATGYGTGTGGGIGNGTGSGIGDGWGGGTGGGAYRPGSGIENPVLRREVKPQYTAEAMRAKIQGTVYLDCVVKADGSVGECGVVRSLDATFGLDQEAVKAAKQWKFAPGKKLGQPVAVLVTIEISFALR